MAQTAVELIEEGIKVREHHWQTEYQQGYQRALSDIAMYIEEAKQMEEQQLKDAIMHALDEDGHTGDWKIKFANEYIKNLKWLKTK